MNIIKTTLVSLIAASSIISISACAAGGDKASAKQQCTQLLKIADKELEAAKADTLADAGSFTKITVILADGALAKQFGAYQKCIRKAKRARELLRPYKNQGKSK